MHGNRIHGLISVNTFGLQSVRAPLGAECFVWG
jgi:hypothetical protein